MEAWGVWCAVLLLGSAVNGDKEIVSSDNLPQPNIGSIHHTELIKEQEKQDDAHSRTFPIMDVFKTSQLYTADDLKESVEFEHKRDNIAQAVENALENLHKKQEEKEKDEDKKTNDAQEKKSAKHFISTKELVDEVVKQELRTSGNDDTETADNDNDDQKQNLKNHEELEKQIHQKLGEISKLETKLFVLVRDIKGFLLEKKETEEHPIGENDFGVPLSTLMRNSDNVKRTLPSVPSIAELRQNPHLVDQIIDKALADESDDNSESGTAQGHTRNTLTDHVYLKDFVKGPLDDIPVSKLAEESDESDTLATDRGVSRVGLVESPLSTQDYKKTLGKKFRHAVM